MTTRLHIIRRKQALLAFLVAAALERVSPAGVLSRYLEAARLAGIAGLFALLTACNWGWWTDHSPGTGSSGGTSNSPPPPPPAFTASLDSTNLAISQGSSAGVWVTLTRSGGFASDVTIALESPPDGVAAYTYTMPSAASAGLVNIEVAPDLAPGTAENLVLVASGGGISVRLPLTLTVGDSRPTSESLIAADLAAGNIDYATSLLYRAYALFHDPRLPPQYAGGANPHNDGFFIEASNPDLSADLQAELVPFLARPTDPASVFHRGVSVARQAASSIRTGATPGDATSSCTLADGEIEYNGWKSVLLSADGAVPVRFWVECSASADLDDTYLALAGETAGLVLPGMTALMGQPVPDKGGNYFGTDNAIDVYLVAGCEQVPRNDSDTLCDEKEKSPSVVGAAPQTYSDGSSTNANASSAFILIDRNELESGVFKSTFAHEFFHVLQDAYNSRIAFSADGSELWFTEASATWAEAHFAPETAAQEVHTRFSNNFQKSSRSLDDSGGSAGDHIYAAYIWPFFFEQKHGATTMQSAWNALSQAPGGDFNQANQLLDGVYKFKDNFRLFAVENLNFDLPDVLTDQNRYPALAKPYPFPGTKPSDLNETELTAPPQDIPSWVFDLGALQSNHLRYYVTSSKVKQVIFRFDRYGSQGGLDIDGIVKIAGQPWQARKYDNDNEIRFCLDKPDQNLIDIYLVLSNHNVPMDQHVQGAVKVETSDVACKDEWIGTATSEFGYTMKANVTWMLDEQNSTDTQAVFYPTGNVSFSSPDCVITPGNQDIQPAEGRLVIDYSTDPPTYHAQGATAWQATYQCAGGGSLVAGAGGIWLADPNDPTLRASGTVPAADANGKTTIGGNAAGGGYTFTWQFTEF